MNSLRRCYIPKSKATTTGKENRQTNLICSNSKSYFIWKVWVWKSDTRTSLEAAFETVSRRNCLKTKLLCAYKICTSKHVSMSELLWVDWFPVYSNGFWGSSNNYQVPSPSRKLDAQSWKRQIAEQWINFVDEPMSDRTHRILKNVRKLKSPILWGWLTGVNKIRLANIKIQKNDVHKVDNYTQNLIEFVALAEKALRSVARTNQCYSFVIIWRYVSTGARLSECFWKRNY